MSTSLVPAGKSGAIQAYDGTDNPWAEMGREVESGAFLNMNGNTGEMTFGSDDNVLPDGSTVISDLFNMQHGWICWKDSEPVEEIMIPITEGKPPREHELTDHGPYDDEDDGWREAVAIPMVIEAVDEDGDHEWVGTKLLFKTSTAGAVRSAKKLSGSFGKMFREHAGELPVVEITTEGYTPREKKYGKKYAITFKIIDWMDETGLAEIVGSLSDEDGEYLPEDEGTDTAPEPEPEPEPEPAAEEGAPPPPRRRRAAKSEDSPPEETKAEEPEKAPARRRSRKAKETEEQKPDTNDQEEAPKPRGRSGGRRTRRFASESSSD